ncbi:MAG: sulfatase-like hydrolase/transferase [Haliscomenobacter sp.]|nr:sulfatase-like hydrolase/transferase [Haliscomenobacter sp.]
MQDVAAPRHKPINILLIAIDDMNNWVGAFGGQAKTPNIDRLAYQGVTFTNAYCAVPACNPSRTAIMTGQRPKPPGNLKMLEISGKNLVEKTA